MATLLHTISATANDAANGWAVLDHLIGSSASIIGALAGLVAAFVTVKNHQSIQKVHREQTRVADQLTKNGHDSPGYPPP